MALSYLVSGNFSASRIQALIELVDGCVRLLDLGFYALLDDGKISIVKGFAKFGVWTETGPT
jgi:hypothetical protein